MTIGRFPHSVFYTTVAVVLIAAALFTVRAHVSAYLWRTFAVAPDVALALNPDAAFALELGEFYFSHEVSPRAYDRDRAERYYKRALELDVASPTAWHQLARISFLRSDFDEALERINKQLDVHGNDFMHAYYVRGLIYGYQEDFDNAVDDFVTYLRWDTDGWYTYNDIAWIYFQAGAYDVVEGVAQKGLERNPDNPWLLMSHGVALYNLGRSEEAHRALERARNEANLLTEVDWRQAYPGNDPKIAEQGLQEFKNAIETNLTLVHRSLSDSDRGEL